jgi:hypothetical protein
VNQGEYHDSDYGELMNESGENEPKSYNRMFREIIVKHANMDDQWELRDFDDELSRGSSDGGQSRRINVNENFIQKFDSFAAAAHDIDKLRYLIYGESPFGGSSDAELRSGVFDQETFQIHWQRIYTFDDSFQIFWYTTVLSNAHMYVSSHNQTEHDNHDTEFDVVAYPAVFCDEQFGNDIMVIKKQFTNYRELLKSVKNLRPPLGRGRATKAIRSH